MLTILKRLRTAAIGGAVLVAAMAAPNASALSQFTVNPNSNGLSSSGSVFTAETLSGTSSARITKTADPGNFYNGIGYIVFTAFNMSSNPIDAGISQLNLASTGYGLFARFQQTFECSGPLAVGVSCAVKTITLQLFGDRGNQNDKSQAALGADPSITDLGTPDVLLATVSQVYAGVAGIDALGGAFQNINSNFVLTDEGKQFFVSPVPFYQLAFSAYNNTSQGLVCNTANCTNPTDVAINSETGITDFRAVPEPGSLVLMGIAMLGLIAVNRKRA